jgi:tetratricopeptide (TPR) repeat protein
MTVEEAVKLLQQRHHEAVFDNSGDNRKWKALLQDYNALLNEQPDHPAVLFGLGTVYLHMDQPGLAISLFHRAKQTGVTGAPPYLNMAAGYKAQHIDDKAREIYHLAIEEANKHPALDADGINADLSAALHGMSTLYVNAGQPNTCLYWLGKALKVNPNDRFALWNKSLALLELGEWEEGFRLYDEAGFMESDQKPIERKLKTYGGLPRWNGTPGQTVITYGEQGVGDEIMFCSMLPDLMKDCKVIIDCDRRIETMLRRSFPDAEAVYPTSGINVAFPWIKDHKVDAYVPMGSLGRLYRKKDADFPKKPFFTADPALVAKWADILKGYPGLKVGLSWAGGLKKTRFDKRSMDLHEWEPIIRTPGAQFFSLQYHSWSPDAAAQAGTSFGIPIHHWGDMIASYEETAAFLMNMDVLVTVNTSLHHLAGALGVNQLCLTPKYCAWRYQCKGPSPWYGNCEMLRQAKDDDWVPVIERAAGIVRKLANEPVRAAA